MWKWIGGIVALVVVCLVGAMWAGYHKLTAAGDVANVVIAGSPDRVFAALANHDSLANWWIIKGSPAPMGHGPLAVGDSLPAQTPRAESRQRLSNWVVDQVTPGKLLVLSLHSDTAGAIVAVRRDSLVARGDSTEVVSAISSPMMDNLQSSDTVRNSRSGSALLGMSSKLIVSAMRLQSKVELTRLKNHIEGRPVDAQP
jgi:uncharacterized protein YndB with AHSA1/START domain